MKKQLVLSLLAAALASAPLSAQRPDSRSVIVVFREGVNLQGFSLGFAGQLNIPPHLKHLDPDVAAAVRQFEGRHGFQASHMYSSALRGFAARLTPDQIERLRGEYLVDYIEEDGVMTANAHTLPWGINRIDADSSSQLVGNGSGAVSNVNAPEGGIDYPGQRSAQVGLLRRAIRHRCR